MTPQAPTTRAMMQGGPEGLEIVIPAARNPVAMVFLGLWLVGWLMGALNAIARLGRDLASDPVLLIWLVVWVVGGGVAGYSWLWMLVGKERILMGSSTLSIKRDVAGLGRTRRYGLSRIRNLRVMLRPTGLRDFGATARAIGLTGGVIAFECAGATIRFGAPLDEAEARAVVERMRQRYAFPEAPAAA